MGAVTAVLIDDKGNVFRGGEELIARWQEQPSSHIWVDMQGLAPVREDAVMAPFGLHHLALRDARRHRHPPKFEQFDDHFFFLLSELDEGSEELDFSVVQLSCFAGSRYLLTRHNQPSETVRHWLAGEDTVAALSASGIRLALEMAITAARHYIEMLLEFEPRLSELEDLLQDKPDDDAMRALTQYRTRLRKLRRMFNYHARIFDVLRGVKADFFNAGDKGNRHLVLDVYEKYERLLSLSTLYYELAGDLIEGYISVSSHELNQTMRILTVLTAIFVPLGFLAGLYGMNFDYMPELHWRWGYFALLGAMATVIVSLLAVFKVKRWL